MSHSYAGYFAWVLGRENPPLLQGYLRYNPIGLFGESMIVELSLVDPFSIWSVTSHLGCYHTTTTLPWRRQCSPRRCYHPQSLEKYQAHTSPQGRELDLSPLMGPVFSWGSYQLFDESLNVRSIGSHERHTFWSQFGYQSMVIKIASLHVV